MAEIFLNFLVAAVGKRLKKKNMSDPNEEIARLRADIASKEEMMNVMKQKTKDFVTKLKNDFQIEKDEKDSQINQVSDNTHYFSCQ